jgi:hypothetical protein
MNEIHDDYQSHTILQFTMVNNDEQRELQWHRNTVGSDFDFNRRRGIYREICLVRDEEQKLRSNVPIGRRFATISMTIMRRRCYVSLQCHTSANV